jgi:hypothetical protein
MQLSRVAHRASQKKIEEIFLSFRTDKQPHHHLGHQVGVRYCQAFQSASSTKPTFFTATNPPHPRTSTVVFHDKQGFTSIPLFFAEDQAKVSPCFFFPMRFVLHMSER